MAEELGDLLFACVNVARRLNVDPELELRAAAERFRARVEEAERLAADAGETWTELDLAAQDRYFDRAKGSARPACGYSVTASNVTLPGTGHVCLLPRAEQGFSGSVPRWTCPRDCSVT